MPIGNTTIRTFPTLKDAQDFYAQGGSDALYNQLYGSGTSNGSRSPYGTVPTTPDPLEEYKKAIDINSSVYPSLKNLIDTWNTDSLNRNVSNLDITMPGSSDFRRGSMENILNETKGIIPDDVVSQLTRQAAERGVGIGSPGSPNVNAALLRAMGLTSLDLQNKAIDQYGKLMPYAPQADKMDWSNFLLNPNDLMQWQYLSNILKSSPDPAAAAQTNMLNGVLGQIMGGGGGNPNKGYFNDSSWLWNTLPRSTVGTGGSSSGGYTTTPSRTNTGGASYDTGEGRYYSGQTPTGGTDWTTEAEINGYPYFNDVGYDTGEAPYFYNSTPIGSGDWTTDLEINGTPYGGSPDYFSTLYW